VLPFVVNQRHQPHRSPSPAPTAAHTTTIHYPLPTISISFEINTYKSASKQMTLSTFRINTYKKQGRGPAPLVHFYPRYILPFSVWCKPFVCHSYENCRGVLQFFLEWNAPATARNARRRALRGGRDILRPYKGRRRRGKLADMDLSLASDAAGKCTTQDLGLDAGWN